MKFWYDTESSVVASQHRATPGDNVLNPLSGWVTSGPQLQVGQRVVGPVEVAMMDGLVREEWPTEVPFHDDSVFESPSVATHSIRANADIPLTGDVAAGQRAETAFLSWTPTTRPRERVTVPPQSMAVTVAQTSMSRLQLAVTDQAVRLLGSSTLPPRLIAAATKHRHYWPARISPDAALLRHRSAACRSDANFN